MWLRKMFVVSDMTVTLLACRICTILAPLGGRAHLAEYVCAMIPPILEICVVWHPQDADGEAVAEQFVEHFHGSAFSGLIGGAVEIYVRSEGWRDPQDAPRPLPPAAALPYGIPGAALTAIVPVLGNGLAA